jgi:hypothetical protein
MLIKGIKYIKAYYVIYLMRPNYFYKIKSDYLDLLPFFLIPTAFLGFYQGLDKINHKSHFTPIDNFSSTIGYTSIGILTGISYPISYPLLASYIIYRDFYKPKNLKDKSDDK